MLVLIDKAFADGIDAKMSVIGTANCEGSPTRLGILEYRWEKGRVAYAPER